jgi:hypothetical protein
MLVGYTVESAGDHPRLLMMQIRKYSWTVYAPGLVLVAAMIVLTIIRRPWPASVPAHFNFRWQVDRWGSPVEATVFIPIVAVITATGMFSSTMWARHEQGRKRFNPSVPVTALPLGAVAGIHLWYWWNLQSLAKTGAAPYPWLWVGIFAGSSLCACLILEKWRMFNGGRPEAKLSGADRGEK